MGCLVRTVTDCVCTVALLLLFVLLSSSSAAVELRILSTMSLAFSDEEDMSSAPPNVAVLEGAAEDAIAYGCCNLRVGMWLSGVAR